MKKALVLFFFLLMTAVAVGYYILPRNNPRPFSARTSESALVTKSNEQFKKLRTKALNLKSYARQKGFSEKYGFLIDMTLPSGRKRFFVYDLQKDSLLHAGLVAHGSCNQSFRHTAYFSNRPNTGCSSEGMYKVGYPYEGRFGKAYKLFGLDSTNSNAFRRAVVLHAYDCVPDKELYPEPLCNSLGCPMTSYNFLDTLSTIIDKSRRPILLWIIAP